MSNYGYNELDDVNSYTGGTAKPDSGDYNVMLTSADLESNSKKTGSNIHVKYSILDGDFAGVDFEEWLSVENQNEMAQNISRSKLKALYDVTNKTNARHFKELEGQVLRVRLIKQEEPYFDKNTGEEKMGSKLNVTMYMSTKGLNADGKEVAPYAGPAIVAAKKKSAAKTNNFNQGGYSSNKSSDPFEDDIPF